MPPRAMPSPSPRNAFTLVELLVVMAVVVILAVMVASAAQAVQVAGKRSACLSNLRQIGAGIGLYAADNDGSMPYGPIAGGMMLLPTNLYPSTGAPTSLISLRDGRPVALGLTLRYLVNPKALFCPGADQPLSAEAELAKVGKKQAQCSYYYRHAGNTLLADLPKTPPPPAPKLGGLGDNRDGSPIRAIVMDTVFYAGKGLEPFSITTRTHHRGKFTNVLYSDGHAKSLDNDDLRFNVDLRKSSNLYDAFSVILKAFEYADVEP